MLYSVVPSFPLINNDCSLQGPRCKKMRIEMKVDGWVL